MPLFQPFRALGYVSDSVPFAVQRRGREIFVTVSVGKAWQIFNAAKLNLVFVGPQLPKSIKALASKGDFTFAASGRDIVVSKRAHIEGLWSGHFSAVQLLLSFGDFLLSTAADHRLLVWELGNFSGPVKDIELSSSFTPTALVHPDTYLNKIVLGSEEGALQLWNISTETLLHTFPGWGSAVRCLTGTPALDVIAIGLADGRVMLFNLRYDEVVTSFIHDAAGGDVTAVAVRSCAGTAPVLVAGGSSGRLTVWDLERRQLQALLKDAHDGPLSNLFFFPSEPVLLSAAQDNSLKEWIFEEAGIVPRLLRFRSGHSSPPTCVSHYGSSGRHILSAGQDRAFRVFSTIQDQQSKELSQGHVQRRAKKLKVKEEDLKLPRVMAMASCETRERDWCNVVTCHSGHPSAYIWQLSKACLGKHILTPPPPPPSAYLTAGVQPAVSAVAMSPCGNSVLLGTDCGTVDIFNIQSGRHRGRFERFKDGPNGRRVGRIAPPLASTRGLMKALEAAEGTTARGGLAAHAGAVVGVACDSCNRTLVTCGYDGFIRIWDYKRKQLRGEIDVGSPMTHMHMHQGSKLLAVALDTLEVQVFDIEAAARVRRFRGHTDRLTALHWSNDARWLFSASLDSTTRVWDVPSARCLEVMNLGPPVTALSLSPSGDLLVTAHTHRRGLYLWANRPLYLGRHLTPQPVPEGEDLKVVDIRMPTVSDAVSKSVGGDPDAGGEVEDEEENLVKEAEVADLLALENSECEQYPFRLIALSMITLSLLPRSQWKSLTHLDIIKERNKPKAPPKKPEAAPFFLPSMPGVGANPVFVTDTGEVEGELTEAGGKAGSHLIRRHEEDFSQGDASSSVMKMLKAGATANDYSPLMEHLRGLGPSALDTELQSVAFSSPDPESISQVHLDELNEWISFMEVEAASGRNFEFIHSFLHRFLQIHGEVVGSHPDLKPKIAVLKNKLSNVWNKIDSLFQDVRCMYGFFAGQGSN